jgi:hypothetical protein
MSKEPVEIFEQAAEDGFIQQVRTHIATTKHELMTVQNTTQSFHSMAN